MSLIAARLRDRGYDELAYEFEALTTELAATQEECEKLRKFAQQCADELDRLQAELAAAKRDDADMRRWWRWWRQAINEAIAKQEPKNVD